MMARGLTYLPPPPAGRAGWPWTADKIPSYPAKADADWPKITIVTPSFNQGHFIEETIRSILLQGYPNLEYIIIDGGSTDETLAVIAKYEPWIHYWISEPDSGMYEALNKGFSRSTGDIMGWSPTGDLYLPSALFTLASIFCRFPEIQWLTSRYKVKCDESGNQTACYAVPGFSRQAFLHGLHFLGGNGYAAYTIQQQSTFWRRSLWDQAGGRMDESLKSAGDFDLWARFSQHAELYAVDAPIGIFRTHSGQTSVRMSDVSLREKQMAFSRAGGKHLGWVQLALRGKLAKALVQRSRSIAWLACQLGIAYRTHIIVWDSSTQTANVKRNYFV